MANYNKDTDYTKLIEQAVKTGNYGGAALLEQQRNNKISDMGLGYERTNNYSQYLPTGGTTPYGSAEAVYTYNASQGNAKGDMNANSAQWWAAKGMGDTAQMQTLEQANKQLATLLGDLNYDSVNGRWSGVANMPATEKAAMTTGVVAEQPTYQSAYNAQIDALLNQYLNREKFSYDAETDPLYQQYKDIYTREGNRSMNDTLAAAASGAGGMSSYAMTAAQQANNYYMAQLGDKIPELQQLAYEMYMNDLGLQQQDIGLLMDMENRDYSRYRDQMGDYQWATGFNYDAYRDTVADEWQQKQWDYGLERDKIDDGRYDSETAYDRAMTMLMQGVMPDSDLLAAAGISTSTANALKSANTPIVTGGSGGGSGYTGGTTETGYTGGVVQPTGGTDNGGLTTEQIKAAQKYYGVTADGKWGPKSQAAAGGLSALDAWLAMSEKTFSSGMINLGYGPIDTDIAIEVAPYGGVVENPDGSVKWADGWNASNYKQKLEEAKKADPMQAAMDMFGMDIADYEAWLKRKNQSGGGANNKQYKTDYLN